MSEQHSDLTPTRPYLLRAMHAWMTDNGQTPLILVDVLQPDVQVPPAFVEDDHIVLNISWSATHNLELGNELLSFDARFSGSPQFVSVPMSAIKGIYARESGQGMMFQGEPGQSAAADSRQGQDSPADGQGPRSVDGPTAGSTDGSTDGNGKKKKPGRPGLRVVK